MHGSGETISKQTDIDLSTVRCMRSSMNKMLFSQNTRVMRFI